MDNYCVQIVAEVQGTGSNGKVYLMSDGHLYLCHSETDSVRYFRCKRFRAGCRGRAIFYATGSNIVSEIHNHDAEGVHELMYRADREAMINQSLNSTTTLLEDIFGDPSNAAQYDLRMAMLRLRERNLPLCESLRQLSEVMRNPDLSYLARIHLSNEMLYQGSGESADQTHFVLFMSTKGCDLFRMSPSVSILRISLPTHLNCEMYVLAAVWERNVIPLVWVLLGKSTYEALCAAFSFLKSKVPSSSFSSILSATDEAGYAFCHVFHCNLNPTLFDFIRDIVSSEGTGITQETLNGSVELKHIVRLCCGLPLLPADTIQIGINIILNEASSCGVTHQAAPLFHHIEENWLHSTNFSMCGDVDRTNKGCEDLRSKITAAVSRSSNGFYGLIKSIVTVTTNTETVIQSVFSGHTIYERQGPVPILAQTDVVNLLQEVLNPSLDLHNAVKNFLLAVALKIDHFL